MISNLKESADLIFVVFLAGKIKERAYESLLILEESIPAFAGIDMPTIRHKRG